MRKICFSSVLQERGGQGIKKGQPTQLNLHEMVEEFTNYPTGDYTLRYSQHENHYSANSNLGFEEGCNPLDQWISSQIQSNKENISDTQPRRKIPNELLKYVQHSSKSPIKQNQNSQPFPKMMDMKQICKEYAENKKKGNNVQDNAPFWKFSSRQDSENEIDKRNFESEIKESLTAEKYKEQIKLDQRENELLSNEFSRLKKETISNAVKTLPEQSKGQNLSAFIEEIKNNLAKEIEEMAEKIIQDRKKEEEEDQELLISQRKSIENNEEQRFEQARKEIGEYLNKRPSSIEREGVHYAKKTSLKAEGLVSFDNDDKNGEAGVGYSFSSDFNSGNNGQIHDQVTQQSQYTLKSNHLNLPSSQISLPNIDEVKSEQDRYEKRDDFIEDSMNINYKVKEIKENEEIDRNYIKEIQSVAYTENQNEYKISNGFGKYLNSRNDIEYIGDEGKVKESPERYEKKSILEQINKTAKSIEDEQEGNEVNISVAEDQSSLKQGSFKDQLSNVINTSIKVENFTLPTNPERGDFKKMTSPDRKTDYIAQVSSPSNNIKSSNYFTSNTVYTPTYTPSYTPSYTETTNYTTLTQPTVYIPQNVASSYSKINFTNILEQADQRQKEMYQTSNTSLIHNSVKIPFEDKENFGNQNSKERINDSKMGSNEDHRKLKITLSPKDRQENVTIGDFKLAPKTGEVFTRVEYQKVHENLSDLGPSYANNNIKQSIGKSLEGQEGKFKLNTMFPNTNTITEIREIKESMHKDKENALIKISKYERTEVYVEQAKPKESIRSNVRGSSQFEFDLDF